MCTVVRHMHDVCAIPIGQNGVHRLLKLLVVKWLGLSVTIRVRVKGRDKERIFSFLFFSVKGDENFCFALMASLLKVQCHLAPFGLCLKLCKHFLGLLRTPSLVSG